MESLLMTLFFVALFGGMFLILLMGYFGAEQDRGKREQASAPAPASARAAGSGLGHPRFAVDPEPAAGGRAPEVAEEAVLRRVQSYIAEEQALAEEFVAHPSVEALYYGGGRAKLN